MVAQLVVGRISGGDAVKPDTSAIAEQARIGLRTLTHVLDWVLAERDAMTDHIARIDRRLAELENAQPEPESEVVDV